MTQFLLTVLEKIDSRSRDTPEAFNELNLTVLSDVAQNGVETLLSVSGEGMVLCEQAMTTLLKGYISNEKPVAWKGLFKEATNIAFMVKYRLVSPLSYSITICYLLTISAP